MALKIPAELDQWEAVRRVAFLADDLDSIYTAHKKFPKMFVNDSSHHKMTLVDILNAQI